MKLNELFRRLSFGELSNLSIADGGEGTLVQSKHPRIIQYTNESLLRLYSRFVLKENDLIIEQVGHITNYHLRREFAESIAGNDGNPELMSVAYIKDLPCEPFDNDVIRIMEVFDSFGCLLPLNDPDHPESLFTPQLDTLQVPRPKHGVALGIRYQARHPIIRDKIIRENEDLLEQEAEVPFFLEGALQALIASKVYSHMNGQENNVKSQEFLATYEMICQEIEAKDLASQTISASHSKLIQRGFK